jgi:hypothetical protein
LPRIARTLVEPVFGTSTKMHLCLCAITPDCVAFYIEKSRRHYKVKPCAGR